MKIYFEQKKPGRSRQAIVPVELDISLEEATLNGIISATVRSCVETYNLKLHQASDDFDTDNLHNLKTTDEIENQAPTGKIAFGFICEGKTVDSETAIANAIQCHEDGLFRIFLNGRMVSASDNEIDIKDGDTLSVVRLTMLAGRLW